MGELLFEIFSEEIPAVMQKNALTSALEFIENKSIELGLLDVICSGYFTPMRLILFIKNVPDQISTTHKVIKGPKVSANEKAIEGFLKKNSLITIEELVIKEISGDDYYFYQPPSQENDIRDALLEIILSMLNNLMRVWSKTMKLSDNKSVWARPIINILCVFEGEVLEAEFAGLRFNNKATGHKFLHFNDENKWVKVSDFDSYKSYMNDHHVIFNHIDRATMIEEEVKVIAHNHGGRALFEFGIIDEIVGITEYPNAYVGKIEEQYLSLPKEILMNVILKTQKYIPIIDQNNNITQFFIFISNIRCSDPKRIIKDNERGVQARLADAQFFYEQDLLTCLKYDKEKMKAIVFHQKLGSMHDKIVRLHKIVLFVAVWVPCANVILSEKAVRLSKIDLTGQVVNEFPELQGVMSSYYAKETGVEESVVEAIKQQYKPSGKNDSLPSGSIAVTLAISDKVDSLVGLFLAGERPTSTKDPYAMRRLALAILRVIIEEKILISFEFFIAKVIKSHSLSSLKSLSGKSSIHDYTHDVANEIEIFCLERFKYYCLSQGIDSLIINARFKGFEKQYSLSVVYHQIYALNAVFHQNEGQKLLKTYKRVYNIIFADHNNKHLIKDKILNILTVRFHSILENTQDEERLAIILDDLEEFIRTCNYDRCYKLLFEYANIVNLFLDNNNIKEQSVKSQKQSFKFLAAFIDRTNYVFPIEKLI